MDADILKSKIRNASDTDRNNRKIDRVQARTQRQQNDPMLEQILLDYTDEMIPFFMNLCTWQNQ